MSIFLSLGNIKGSASACEYKGWINIDDISFPGITAQLGMEVGKTVDRTLSKLNFSPLILVKSLDKSSTELFAAAHSGEVFPTAEIHYAHTGEPLFTYAKIILNNATITHYAEHHVAGDSRPRELLRFAYSQIQRTYIPRGPNNERGSPLTTGYDIECARSL